MRRTKLAPSQKANLKVIARGAIDNFHL